MHGVLCEDSGHVALFSEDEILASLKVEKIVLGSGGDKCVLRPRKFGDGSKPISIGGPCGTVTPEEYYETVALSVAREQTVDILTCGTLPTVYGAVVKPDTVTEVMAVRKELQFLRYGYQKNLFKF